MELLLLIILGASGNPREGPIARTNAASYAVRTDASRVACAEMAWRKSEASAETGLGGRTHLVGQHRTVDDVPYCINIPGGGCGLKMGVSNNAAPLVDFHSHSFQIQTLQERPSA